MATSKAFRAQLRLSEHEAAHLQRGATLNCAMGAVFSSDRGRVVLVGLRDTPRTSASFGRTIRSALRRMCISTVALRGHWCHLISEQEAITLCTATAPSMELAAAPSGPGRGTSDGGGRDDGAKIVPLR